MILHLVRHPRPLVEPGICYGRLDVAGENAGAVAGTLRGELPPGLPVWTSPLRRCLALAEALHPMPRVDGRLVEMDFGDWEGRAWDALPRAELDAWAADIAGYAPPGGESPLAMQCRVLAFLAELTVPEAVVVTHAGVMRTLVAHVRGLPPARWPELQFAFGSRTVVEFRR
jgi:alpha-ribazole phosphatase